jgi:hypothetical protein
MSKCVYLLCLAIGLFSAGCKTASVITQTPSDPSESEVPFEYEYPAQVLAMPSRGAIVVATEGCYVELQRDDGTDRRFRLGSPQGDPTVRSFIGTLEVGKWYPLPDAFMAHLKTIKEQEPNK